MRDALMPISQGKPFAFLLAIFAGIAVHAAGDVTCSMAVRDVMEPLPPGAVTLTGGLEVPIEKSIAHWHKGNVPYREFAEFFRKGRPKFALGEMWGSSCGRAPCSTVIGAIPS